MSAKRGDAAVQGAPLGTPRSNQDMFIPVSVGRISEVIIEQIRQLIHSGQLVEGSRLPSERDLCERFGVSRVTVREALRVLESSELIEIKVGARGGAFVTTPTSGRVETGITDLLAMSGLTAMEVTEARRLIEMGVAEIACHRATLEDVNDLSALCDTAEQALRDGAYTMELSTEFHIRLARATHNRAISMLVQSLRKPILLSLEEARQAAPSMGDRGVGEHRRLVEAIASRDVTSATEIMDAHLTRTFERVSHAPARSGDEPAPEARG
jgi:GntR family transcriptional repressor for pyruvate dehydrogenase complex